MIRPRITALTLLLLVLASLNASPAFAHGLGRSQDLPLPLWIFLYGSAAAVLVSFVPISIFTDSRHGSFDYPRFNLLKIGPLRALLTARPFLLGLRLLSVTLFLLVILSGLLGQQNPGSNFAPTFVWITWWVGLSFFTALVGNIWPLMNPWKIIFEWADRLARRLGAKRGLELGVPYSTQWGVWPAVMFYATFVWLENVFEGKSLPAMVAILALFYSLLTWWGMLAFGKDTWLRRGEAFSVFFDLVGKFAPTEVRVRRSGPCEGCSDACGSGDGGCVNCYECFARALPEDRQLNLRPWAVGLGSGAPVPPGGVFFVILVLAGIAFDGLLPTPLWTGLESTAPIPRTLSETLGLIALPLFFLAVYLGFVKLSQLLGGGTGALRRYAAGYVYSLVPIAIVYEMAHYFTYLLIQGQGIIRHLSDPFGWGWNLFGTGGYVIDSGIIRADTVWYVQVVLIVVGHMIAVYLAHLAALSLIKDRRSALLSQLPMLALMVFYTVFSLWLLSQIEVPLSENVSQPGPTENLTQPPMPELPMPQPPIPRAQ